MSKGWKRKLKTIDKHLDEYNDRIYNEGYNMFHGRDNFERKRVDHVDKIGKIKK